MFIYLFSLFGLFIVGLELFTGFAFIGWTGDNMLVERKKNPGPYWFGIAVHILLALGIPILRLYVIWSINNQ